MFKEHRMCKFTSNTDLTKQDFLNEKKLSDRSRFWKKVNKEIYFDIIEHFNYVE